MDSVRPLALVTGASRGIGAAVATTLAPTPDLLSGRREAAPVPRWADTPGPRALPWPVDLTDAAALAAPTERIDELDVLVHSAGGGLLGTRGDHDADTRRGR